MLNLENLRKQAKQLVRWHRERVWTVAEQIRTLPRFQQLSDREILEADFKLSDAQELIARRAGFESWQALLDELPESREAAAGVSPAVRLLTAQPFVFVRDIAKACEFFEQTLGFEVAFKYGEPAYYAQVERDGVRLSLRCTDQPVIDGALAKRDELLCALIEVEGVKQLYLDFERRGASFHQALRTEPYGLRSFIVEDPDGNLLEFHGKLEASS